MSKTIRVLVVGLGTMGLSHARAYRDVGGFELAGLCSNRAAARGDLAAEFPEVPRFDDFPAALRQLGPDAVAICTYADTHAPLAIQAFAAGAHVFCEKPLADTIGAAESVAAAARAAGKVLLVGYILRVHPSWTRFVELARELGKPLAMRMNLNQQSSGSHWQVHKKLMRTTSPIVDCAVHYVDVMCQIAQSRPVGVHAVGVRLSDEIAPHMFNWGHLHIAFANGSAGWYEVGWGPMMSETAHFIKDVIGPRGSVSMVAKGGASAEHEGHTSTGALLLHHAALDAQGRFARPDEMIDTAAEPDHQGLCNLEQIAFRDAILHGRDLSAHHEDALNSLRIVLAADESVRTGAAVRL